MSQLAPRYGLQGSRIPKEGCPEEAVEGDMCGRQGIVPEMSSKNAFE